MQSEKDRIERAANVAILIATIALVVLVANDFLRRAGAAQTVPPTFRIGDRFPSIRGLNFASHPHGTLVLFISSRCHFCSDSMPFYRHLVTARRQPTVSPSLIAVGYESAESLREYLSAHNVALDGEFELGDQVSELAATPTLVLVDASSRVLRVWTGELPPDEQADVERRVGAGSL